ncbi:hypothetical protein BDV27DRAFT_138758 [Aspergillus caelatus]|uniref:Uncharacterized protein n=1 Tax=Aspergillus caelatus TaxID=61420 RepID=A0A5N6ZJW3_9EURO|nr:uncharacterized protein BDV27DRAFT_138758 [Aspergillus caelatus]KAE8357755.1 hypothetical protein BDV27DRAFT_138758 [Aspergillus caelatus]
MLWLLQLRIGSGSFLCFPLFIFPYSLHVNRCGECSLHGAEGFLGSMQRCPPPSLPRQRCTYILRAWRGIHGCSHTIRTQARVKPSHGSSPAGSAAKKWLHHVTDMTDNNKYCRIEVYRWRERIRC